MHHWIKRVFVVVAPLLFTGCLWGPGKFTSDLTLKKDGSFVLDYRGEIVFELPETDEKPAWSITMAHCFKDMKGSPPNPFPEERLCTKSEVEEQRAQYEKEAESKKQESAEMAKSFGMPGLNDDSNRAFAAKLAKSAGWRSVIYRGNGVFDVDYHFEGRATQDFVFPLMPDSGVVIPFIALRRRADGSILVTAPALSGSMTALGPAAAQMGGKGKQPPSRADGRFTVRTDGEILTNNSEDGAAPNPLGRALHWDVNSGSTKIPETLIRL